MLGSLEQHTAGGLPGWPDRFDPCREVGRGGRQNLDQQYSEK